MDLVLALETRGAAMVSRDQRKAVQRVNLILAVLLLLLVVGVIARVLDQSDRNAHCPPAQLVTDRNGPDYCRN